MQSHWQSKFSHTGTVNAVTEVQ